LETIQVSRREFAEFGRRARDEGLGYVGGCCGCNAAYIRALASGLGLRHHSPIHAFLDGAAAEGSSPTS
jgi:hypothetical protein